jgi:8-oxo-dGTP pyrophosphatase MutT (NUDIX family)
MSSACSNCGRHGHFFRECHEPITSLGIIAFRRLTLPPRVQWLLIRRRDSLGFIEIMRGKYELRDEAGIQALVDQTTLPERVRLLTQTFQDLWRELWNGAASRRYLAEYEQAKAKFDVLRGAGGLTLAEVSRPNYGIAAAGAGAAGRRSLADYCEASSTRWMEPEWGFPKGRRSSTETDIGCALRETTEETGVPAAALRVLSTGGSTPLLEEFTGSNGVSYRHKYWLAEAPASLEVRLDPSNADQRREVGDVRWCSMEEALALIRPYNAEKRAVLMRALSLV